MRSSATALLVIGILLAAVPDRASGQATVSGMVIDAGTERPLPNALVSLWSATHGRLAGQVLSDSAGLYRIGNVGVGAYSLAVRAIGYRPSQLTVVLDSAAVSRVSVALAVHPVRLQSIRVARPVASSFGDVLNGGAAPLSGEQRPAGMSLDPASRVLTTRDVRDAVTFAERDPMRALQRLPGVATRDEYSGAMWTRGSSFDKTTVTFDGLPLFNALHAAGLMSTINPDVVGSLEFHPGVQPAGSLVGGAATAAFQSRRAEAFERAHAAAELSLLTGRVAVERASRDGAYGVLVAARRSHVDRSSALMESVLGARAPVPFVFSDFVIRADAPLTPSTALEVAAIRGTDRLWGDVPGVVARTTGDWGGGATRASIVHRNDGREVRFTLGASGFNASAVSHDTLLGGKLAGYQYDECGCVEFATEFSGQPMSNTIGYRVAELLLRQRDDAGRPVLEGGLQFAGFASRFTTTGSWPHGQEPGTTLSRSTDRALAVAWAERMLTSGRTSVVLGMRVEHDVYDPLLVAPRITARYQLTRNSSVTAGASRGYQHAQALSPTGSGRLTIATADMFWIVSGGDIPTLRADLVSAGWNWSSPTAKAEVGVTGYARRSHGLLVPDPQPGVASQRELFVTAAGDARGAEVTARKDFGESSIMASYARGRSTLSARDMEYAAPWARETVIRGAASVNLGKGARWSSQYTWESGAPYTQYFSGYPSCYRERTRRGTTTDFTCRWGFPPSLGMPSARRMAAQYSLDSALEWVFKVHEARYGVFVQGANLLHSLADATYLESHGSCVNMPAANTPCDPVNGRYETFVDATLRGMPRTWSAGVRVVY